MHFYHIRNRMRIKPNFKLREIAGETIIVNQGTAQVNMTRIISLNASARLLYENLSGMEFSVEDATRVLCETYGISKEQALKDSRAWAVSLIKCGVVE